MINESHKYMPENLAKHADDLKSSNQFERLMNCLAEWLALMELCEDLLNMISLYGISSYIDEESLINKLKNNWSMTSDSDTSS